MALYKRNPDPRIKPPVGSILNPDHPLSRGLAILFILNEAGGSLVFDLAKTGRTGNFNGAGEHWYGNSAQFNGTDDYIKTPVDDFGLPLTLVARAFPTSMSDQYTVLSYADQDTVTNTYYRISTNATGYWRLHCRDGVSSPDISKSGYSPNQWYSLAGIVSSNNGTNLFIDGESVVSTTTNATALASPDILSIGARILSISALIQHLFPGFIDYGGIYNRALTPDEIAWLHAEPYANILQPQYWYMVDFGAGAAPDNTLTATDIATGTPAVDTPDVAQTFSLAASDIATGAPAVDAPDIAQQYDLTTTDIAAGSPMVDAPTIMQGQALITTDIVAGSAVVDTPALATVFDLVAENIVAGAPVVGLPSGWVEDLSAAGIWASTDRAIPFLFQTVSKVTFNFVTNTVFDFGPRQIIDGLLVDADGHPLQDIEGHPLYAYYDA